MIGNVILAADSTGWPWSQTKYLTQSNWTTFVRSRDSSSNKTSEPVWLIFYYLHYCGFCKRVESGWEAVARYAQSIAIGLG